MIADRLDYFRLRASCQQPCRPRMRQREFPLRMATPDDFEGHYGMRVACAALRCRAFTHHVVSLAPPVSASLCERSSRQSASRSPQPMSASYGIAGAHRRSRLITVLLYHLLPLARIDSDEEIFVDCR